MAIHHTFVCTLRVPLSHGVRIAEKEGDEIERLKIVGDTELTYGKMVYTLKKAGENDDAHSERTWLEKAHTDEDGNLIIPGQALKKALINAAGHLREGVPGKDRTEFKSRFRPGIQILKDLPLGINVDSIGKSGSLFYKKTLFVPARAKAGTACIFKHFPTVKKGWETQAEIHVFDSDITSDVLLRHLKAAGIFVGLLSLRVGTGNICGMFHVEDFDVEQID